MIPVNHSGLPAAACLASASPHEAKLVEYALNSLFLAEIPEKFIGDKAYDSDHLDENFLKKRGVELSAPQQQNNAKNSGRKLRRHKRRWKIER